jgi:hypothetical protein
MTSTYTCDICGKARFAKLEEAEAHEAQCQGSSSSTKRVSSQHDDYDDTQINQNKEKICWKDGCMNIAEPDQGGRCIEHMIKKKEKKKPKEKKGKPKCSFEGCTNLAIKLGVCWRHGAKTSKPECSVESCTNLAIKLGVCWRHGAKTSKPKCSVDRCTSYVQNNGVCHKHGAERSVSERSVCTAKGCKNYAIKVRLLMLSACCIFAFLTFARILYLQKGGDLPKAWGCCKEANLLF